MSNILIQHMFHIIIVVELLGGLVLWTTWGIKNKSKKGYAVAPILFFINALLYTILSIYGNLSKELLQNWADVVSIHGISVIIMGIMAMLYSTGSSFRGENKNGNQ